MEWQKTHRNTSKSKSGKQRKVDTAIREGEEVTADERRYLIIEVDLTFNSVSKI